MHYSELYGYLPREFSMLLVASPAKLQECAIADIVCLSMPIRAHELIDTVEMMAMNFYREQKRRKLSVPKRRSDKETKIIQDAKALLTERNCMSEQEAHRYI